MNADHIATYREALKRWREAYGNIGKMYQPTIMDRIDAALAALDAQEQAPRTEWEPVEDGEYPMVENAQDDADFLYVFGNTDLEVCTWVERGSENIMLDLDMVICRRKKGD